MEHSNERSTFAIRGPQRGGHRAPLQVERDEQKEAVSLFVCFFSCVSYETAVEGGVSRVQAGGSVSK